MLVAPTWRPGFPSLGWTTSFSGEHKSAAIRGRGGHFHYRPVSYVVGENPRVDWVGATRWSVRIDPFFIRRLSPSRKEICDAEPSTAVMTTHQRNVTRSFSSRSNRPTSDSTRRRSDQSVNAKASYEHYMALARAAALTDDVVETENCYQHAEHYFRVMKERTE